MANTDVGFSFSEAAHTMGVTPERLERLIDEGKITAERDGPDWRISRKSILDYMATVSMVGKERGKKAT